MTNRSLLFSLLVLEFAGPATAQTATELSPKDLKSALTGMTVPLGGSSMARGKGGIFFKDGKTAEVIWDGKTDTGTWRTASKSRLCYTFELFGGEECLTFLRDGNGGYLWRFDGKTRELPKGSVVKGKAF